MLVISTKKTPAYRSRSLPYIFFSWWQLRKVVYPTTPHVYRYRQKAAAGIYTNRKACANRYNRRRLFVDKSKIRRQAALQVSQQQGLRAAQRQEPPLRGLRAAQRQEPPLRELRVAQRREPPLRGLQVSLLRAARG